MRTLDELAAADPASETLDIYVIVDRLVAGGAEQRLLESVETAFAQGMGTCFVFVETFFRGAKDDSRFEQRIFCEALRCPICRIDFPEPDPKRLSFDSPLGACPVCEGFGNVMDLDMELIVPDPSKSIRDGAIAPWNSKSYAHELEELLALAPRYDLRVDVPYSELSAREIALVRQGVPERKFGGLEGFFAWLERRKYKMHLRVFLSRWRRFRTCPACEGRRLRPEALATQLGGRNIAELAALTADEAAEFFAKLELSSWEQSAGRTMLDQIRARAGFLREIGLGYLSLDRALRTLSGGEMQRVSLATALGSSLVNMLYVLDEPSIGLHPHDVERLVGVIGRLRDRGNTVVVVEHEPALVRAADQVVEIGPGAGERGGKILFQGTPADLEATTGSLTGDYLSGRRGRGGLLRRRETNRGSIRLVGARGNNLKNITVEFPLGVLCVVTGVSGSGKSTLIEDTLYPALLRRLRRGGASAADYDDVYGAGQIEDVILVDQSPIGRSPRSNPVTYVKAFDEIRAVFAETVD
ncbi:MAG: excinuclease ABC subunit A, partial [Pirellulales bacterium]